MLKTNAPGEPGFLDATAMQKKVIELWYGSEGALDPSDPKDVPSNRRRPREVEGVPHDRPLHRQLHRDDGAREG